LIKEIKREFESSGERNQKKPKREYSKLVGILSKKG